MVINKRECLFRNHPKTPTTDQLVTMSLLSQDTHERKVRSKEMENSSSTAAINKTPIVLGWVAYSENSSNKRDPIASVSYKKRH